MKNSKLFHLLSVATLVLWTAGCKQESQSAADQTKEAATAATDTVAKTLESAKDAGAKVATEATEKAKEFTATASAKAQEVIIAAKTLVSEGKFQDALTELKALAGEKLSVDQQAIVDGLKAQIEKALNSGAKTATDAAAGLLSK